MHFSSGLGRRGFLGGLAAAGISGTAHANSVVPVEKAELKVGFVPISCAAPLIMAVAKGFFQEEGLNVHLQKIAGWALVRDRLLNGELDASQLLAPMPISLSLGLGSAAQPVRAITMQNINGQAITLALKHHNRRDPRDWKGMTFAIPFEYSMHNLLLRDYLAHYGLDPDHDVTLRITSPPDMVANLRAGNIDGFLGPDPFNQRAVYEQIGFIQTLTAQIWDGHPCCAFGMTQPFIDAYPNTYSALQRAMIRAAAWMNAPENRLEAARIMAQPAYLNQPEIVIRQSLTGHYADGLGVVQDNPHRAGYSPYPYYSMAMWIESQLRRWGYLQRPTDALKLAREIYLFDDVVQQARVVGPLSGLQDPVAGGFPEFSVLGQTFPRAGGQAL
ncbi:CmpA/NrtA family ABC transporter substrate-binding protein [Acetobacter conturbans]|nr:CmpA/NrtA family ABC transporter substrate-binding protein [Acetobacter conturbans]